MCVRVCECMCVSECVCVCIVCVNSQRILYEKEISDIKSFVLHFFVQISLTWKTFLRIHFKSCKDFCYRQI